MTNLINKLLYGKDAPLKNRRNSERQTTALMLEIENLLHRYLGLKHLQVDAEREEQTFLDANIDYQIQVAHIETESDLRDARKLRRAVIVFDALASGPTVFFLLRMITQWDPEKVTGVQAFFFLLLTSVVAWFVVLVCSKFRYLDDKQDAALWRKALAYAPVVLLTGTNFFIQQTYGPIMIFLGLVSAILYWKVIEQSPLFARERQMKLGKKLLKKHQDKVTKLKHQEDQIHLRLETLFGKLTKVTMTLRERCDVLSETLEDKKVPDLLVPSRFLYALNRYVLQTDFFTLPKAAQTEPQEDTRAFDGLWQLGFVYGAGSGTKGTASTPSVSEGYDEQIPAQEVTNLPQILSQDLSEEKDGIESLLDDIEITDDDLKNTTDEPSTDYFKDDNGSGTAEMEDTFSPI